MVISLTIRLLFLGTGMGETMTTYLQNAYSVPGPVLRTPCALSHSILSTTLGVKYNYDLYFANEEI